MEGFFYNCNIGKNLIEQTAAIIVLSKDWWIGVTSVFHQFASEVLEHSILNSKSAILGQLFCFVEIFSNEAEPLARRITK